MAIFTNQATLSYRNGSVNSNVVTGEILEVLSATKNALTETYSAGDRVTYVLSILNSGATAITNISVSDDLGARRRQLVVQGVGVDAESLVHDSLGRAAKTHGEGGQ